MVPRLEFLEVTLGNLHRMADHASAHQESQNIEQGAEIDTTPPNEA